MANQSRHPARKKRAAPDPRRLDALLDQALMETFPASDPVAISVERVDDGKTDPPETATRSSRKPPQGD